MQYPNIPSVLHPAPHNEDITVPEAPKSYDLKSDETSESEPSTSYKQDYCPTFVSEAQLITQSDIKDFVRNVELPKNKAELLDFRLQLWNLLADDVRISHFPSPSQRFSLILLYGK